MMERPALCERLKGMEGLGEYVVRRQMSYAWIEDMSIGVPRKVIAWRCRKSEIELSPPNLAK